MENHFIEEIKNYTPEFLSVNSSVVLAKLQAGDAAWEQMVPSPIAEIIKSKKLLGYNFSTANEGHAASASQTLGRV